MSRPRVALTGSTGMVGRRIGDALLARQDLDVSVLVRGASPSPSSFRRVDGDLGDETTLARFVEGADVLIHAASYVGPDEALQRETNVRGTERLYRMAEQAGVRRILYLSTAGVYGDQAVNGMSERTALAAPVSALSISRRHAELETLSFGGDGIVLRPNLVTGEGDRWFLAPLVAAMIRLDGWIGSDRSRVSWIDSSTLGVAAVELATAAHAAGAYHAAYPAPEDIRALVAPIFAAIGRPLPTRVISVDEAAAALISEGVSRRALEMIADDRWLTAEKLWSEVPALDPAPRALGPRDLFWYSRMLMTDRLQNRPIA